MSVLFEAKELKKYFKVGNNRLLHAVDNVSFQLEAGKTLGVVGESGCGKSTLGRVILHLLDPTSGQMFFEGEDVTNPDKEALKKLREDIQIIFQDPFSSLDPRMSVRETIIEPLIIKGGMDKDEMEARVDQLIETVGLSQRFKNSYPHELDGGRRQRIGIARALALSPKLIVCDEPVSALDVSVQAQILNLMLDLQEERNFTYIFITHDLSVVKYISDEIMVMYLGQVVEMAPSEELFANPVHPYTQALLSAIPVPDIHAERNRIIMKGELTSPINPDKGCRFAARCPYAREECKQEQKLVNISNTPGVVHNVACHYMVSKDSQESV